MRIILSQGKVNIFNLAKNAGTSVEQIERFYSKHLPLSREMVTSLQSFRPPAPEAILPPASGLPYAPLRPAQTLADDGRVLT